MGVVAVLKTTRVFILSLPLVLFLLRGGSGQTEGDTGYDYNDAYEMEYDEDVIGLEPSFDVPIVNVTVVSGQVAVLPCSIDYLGKYKVTWTDHQKTSLTYEDRRVVDDPRFSIVRPYVKEWNLRIQDVQWSDQGQYRCAVNTSPVKNKVIQLYVKVPAQIIDALSSDDLTVQEGDVVVLICNVTGVPHPEVTWFRRAANSKVTEKESKKCNSAFNPVIMAGHTPTSQTSHVPLFTGISLQGEMIIIQNVSRYCDDIYECVADNGVPPAVSRQMRVTVEFAPEIRLPNARMGQKKGRDTILECQITGFPLAVNYWTKDGKKLTSSVKHRIEAYDEGDHMITLSLRIRDLDEIDYGEYRCIAANSLGRDEEAMFLYQVTDPEPPRRPVTTTPRRVEVPIHTPRPEPPSVPYGPPKSPKKPINNPEPNQSTNKGESVPAQIIDALSSDDLTVQEGDVVVLICNVTGVPHPEVTWFRRAANSKVTEKESKKCNSAFNPVIMAGHTPTSQTSHVPLFTGISLQGEMIIIQNVSRYCDDIYECVADNGVPPAVSRQMRVTVEFAPEIRLPNARMGQKKGRDTILECQITGFPLAVNYWTKDGKKLTSSVKHRIEAYDEGDHMITLSLRIRDLDEIDYGEYRCIAANSLGRDEEAMFLYQVTDPEPPRRPVTTTPRRVEVPIHTPRPEPPSVPYGPPKSPKKPINNPEPNQSTNKGESVHLSRTVTGSGSHRCTSYISIIWPLLLLAMLPSIATRKV